MIYLELLVTVLLLNVAPAFVPPTWTVLVYFIIKHQMPLPAVVLIGVTAATLGRYILAQYIHWIAKLLFNKAQLDNIGYLGSRLGKTQWANFLFTFIYSLTPLSTTALFVAAGVAKVKMAMVLLGFFMGRLISYTVLALSAKALSSNVTDLWSGGISFESVLTIVIALAVFFIFVFIDWKELLEHRQIKMHFDVWRWSKKESVFDRFKFWKKK